MRKLRDKYEFDVAISFAGEQRSIAERLADLLTASGISAFYDKHHKSRLWGKDRA